MPLILDYLSRLIQRVCGGDWHDVHDKAQVVWIKRFREQRGRMGGSTRFPPHGVVGGRRSPHGAPDGIAAAFLRQGTWKLRDPL
jgi:hypothetical protein